MWKVNNSEMVTICEGGRGRVWKWARLETALLAQINVEARINFTRSENKFVFYNVELFYIIQFTVQCNVDIATLHYFL